MVPTFFPPMPLFSEPWTRARNDYQAEKLALLLSVPACQFTQHDKENIITMITQNRQIKLSC